MTTEIYIQGKTKNPARLKTAWAKWSIVCVLNSGQVVRKNGTVCINNATTKRAVLTALSQALSRFNRPAVLKIYISDDFVRNSLSNGWTMRTCGAIFRPSFQIMQSRTQRLMRYLKLIMKSQIGGKNGNSKTGILQILRSIQNY